MPVPTWGTRPGGEVCGVAVSQLPYRRFAIDIAVDPHLAKDVRDVGHPAPNTRHPTPGIGCGVEVKGMGCYWKKLAAMAVLILGWQPPLLAKLACRVMFYAGQVHDGNVSVSFRNQGKAPVRELVFACSAHQGSRRDCHTETGVFFPATPYDISFSYPDKAPRNMTLSLKAAFFADGLQWTSLRDEPCKTLRVASR